MQAFLAILRYDLSQLTRVAQHEGQASIEFGNEQDRGSLV